MAITDENILCKTVNFTMQTYKIIDKNDKNYNCLNGLAYNNRNLEVIGLIIKVELKIV